MPASQKASDVTRAFEHALARLHVRIQTQCRVSAIATKAGRVTGVVLEHGETLPADAVIVCTGGVSYPSTGSTGDGYVWLKACGHNVIAPKPSLIPLTSEEAADQDRVFGIAGARDDGGARHRTDYRLTGRQRLGRDQRDLGLGIGVGQALSGLIRQ